MPCDNETASDGPRFEPGKDVILSPFTTIGIGGPARYYAPVRSQEEVAEALEWARRRNLQLFVLGGGSNLLISDEGFPGLVMHMKSSGLTLESEDESSVVVKVAAGEEWDGLVALAVRRGWAGIECLSGIPGSVGASPIQNVGAYGQEVSETIVRVEAMERSSGIVRSFSNVECGFQYRQSVFKREERDRWVILSVSFRLVPGGPAAIRYPELERALEGSDAADLAKVRETVIAIRKKKGMVIDPGDPDTRSDGSFFMNPILDDASLRRFLERAQAPGIDESRIPMFPAADGFTKLSAAWLIENAGFEKGFVLGNAGLSSKHTLAVVNRGGATAAEIVRLVEAIQERVEQVFGVKLHPEPNFIGFGD